MSIRTAILSGAAVLVFSAAGACAQDNYGGSRYGNGPPESSPAEMQQTQDLNQQSLNGTATSSYDSQTADGAPPRDDDSGAQQAQYQQQQEQYQDQMQRYQNQQDRYRYERQRYAQDARAYDLAQYSWSYPAPFVYRYGDEYGLQPLYLMAEPSQQLSQVPVEGPGGRWVGRVRNVETAPDGRPWRVEIALNRRVSVWVRPGDLRFDPSEGILYTDLRRDQLWTQPGATIESGPL